MELIRMLIQYAKTDKKQRKKEDEFEMNENMGLFGKRKAKKKMKASF